jgi:RNA polymerase sigma factor (sigma-70 family)
VPPRTGNGVFSAFGGLTHGRPGHYRALIGALILFKMSTDEALADETPAPLDVLLDNHRVFLGYLSRKVGDRDLAEDILQDAFAKVVERPDLAPTDQGLVPWFYRTLRNAAIDRFRRRGAATRAVEAFARELESYVDPSAEMHVEICECVTRLAVTLKPEYAEALREIDVRGTPVKDFAMKRGLSASNAGVRVFRARDALKRRLSQSCGTCADHGCLNCTCRPGQD